MANNAIQVPRMVPNNSPTIELAGGSARRLIGGNYLNKIPNEGANP
jgi:hypothetical protein